MYLFKTSGGTLPLVVDAKTHGYATRPADWNAGEIVLLSKNKGDLEPGEKQIQYIARIVDVRRLRPGEAEAYWGVEYEGKYEWLIELSDICQLAEQFNLSDAIGSGAEDYWGVRSFKRLGFLHEVKIERLLEESRQLDLQPSAGSTGGPAIYTASAVRW